MAEPTTEDAAAAARGEAAAEDTNENTVSNSNENMTESNSASNNNNNNNNNNAESNSSEDLGEIWFETMRNRGDNNSTPSSPTNSSEEHSEDSNSNSSTASSSGNGGNGRHNNSNSNNNSKKKRSKYQKHHDRNKQEQQQRSHHHPREQVRVPQHEPEVVDQNLSTTSSSRQRGVSSKSDHQGQEDGERTNDNPSREKAHEPGHPTSAKSEEISSPQHSKQTLGSSSSTKDSGGGSHSSTKSNQNNDNSNRLHHVAARGGYMTDDEGWTGFSTWSESGSGSGSASGKADSNHKNSSTTAAASTCTSTNSVTANPHSPASRGSQRSLLDAMAHAASIVEQKHREEQEQKKEKQSQTQKTQRAPPSTTAALPSLSSLSSSVVPKDNKGEKESDNSAPNNEKEQPQPSNQGGGPINVVGQVLPDDMEVEEPSSLTGPQETNKKRKATDEALDHPDQDDNNDRDHNDEDTRGDDANGNNDNNNDKGRKRRAKKSKVARRLERNAREKQRSGRITDQFQVIKDMLTQAGVTIPKDTKGSILSIAYQFIHKMKQHHQQREQENQIMREQIDSIGQGGMGPQAAQAVQYAARKNGLTEAVPAAAMAPNPPVQQQQQQQQQQKQELVFDPLTKVQDKDYPAIWNHAPTAIALSTLGGTFLDCNNVFCKLLQCSRTELRKISIFHLLDNADKEPLQRAFSQVSMLLEHLQERIADTAATSKDPALPKPIILEGSVQGQDNLGLGVSLVKRYRGEENTNGGTKKVDIHGYYLCVTLVHKPTVVNGGEAVEPDFLLPATMSMVPMSKKQQVQPPQLQAPPPQTTVMAPTATANPGPLSFVPAPIPAGMVAPVAAPAPFAAATGDNAFMPNNIFANPPSSSSAFAAPSNNASTMATADALLNMTNMSFNNMNGNNNSNTNNMNPPMNMNIEMDSTPAPSDSSSDPNNTIIAKEPQKETIWTGDGSSTGKNNATNQFYTVG